MLFLVLFAFHYWEHVNDIRAEVVGKEKSTVGRKLNAVDMRFLLMVGNGTGSNESFHPRVGQQCAGTRVNIIHRKARTVIICCICEQSVLLDVDVAWCCSFSKLRVDYAHLHCVAFCYLRCI